MPPTFAKERGTASLLCNAQCDGVLLVTFHNSTLGASLVQVLKATVAPSIGAGRVHAVVGECFGSQQQHISALQLPFFAFFTIHGKILPPLADVLRIACRGTNATSDFLFFFVCRLTVQLFFTFVASTLITIFAPATTVSPPRSLAYLIRVDAVSRSGATQSPRLENEQEGATTSTAGAITSTGGRASTGGLASTAAR